MGVVCQIILFSSSNVMSLLFRPLWVGGICQSNPQVLAMYKSTNILTVSATPSPAPSFYSIDMAYAFMYISCSTRGFGNSVCGIPAGNLLKILVDTYARSDDVAAWYETSYWTALLF